MWMNFSTEYMFHATEQDCEYEIDVVNACTHLSNVAVWYEYNDTID